LEISVLIAVHNGEAHIDSTLDSLAAALPANCEVLLVDDGSTDRTVARALAHQDLPLRVFQEVRAGQTAALNRGLAQATGRYVARLDCGDTCHPRRLIAQRDFLDQHADLLLVGCRVRRLDREGRPLGKSEVVCDPQQIARGLLRINLFQHSALMARRQALVEVGGYRPFFHFSQDLDLLLRLSERGRLGSLAETLSDWTLHPAAVSFRHRRSQSAFARLARECARRRRAGLSDPVDSGEATTPAIETEPLTRQLACYHLEVARALLMGDRPAEARAEMARAEANGLPRTATWSLRLLAVLPTSLRHALRRLRIWWLTR
jgi:glycosyltransferase involved in cell wall biosynthesis